MKHKFHASFRILRNARLYVASQHRFVASDTSFHFIKTYCTKLCTDVLLCMANYHLSVRMISRQGGKSCVRFLSYCSATILVDSQTGESWNHPDKDHVKYVEILVPEGAPEWINEIAQECKHSPTSAMQKFSDACEGAEKRKDSQVYREVEVSLPNELTDEQNITWLREFVRDVYVKRGMVAVLHFHAKTNEQSGIYQPHCHIVLTTRHLLEEGFGLKNREWNQQSILEEAREQYAAYQNAALKEHGFDIRVDHRSYVEREIDVEPQPKLGRPTIEVDQRIHNTDKKALFDCVRLKNQFKILKNPELVLSIVTSNHSTFTAKEIAKVLNRYIDDPEQFQNLYNRLKTSSELVHVDTFKGEEVFTTRDMLRVEMRLLETAENFSAQMTHPVDAEFVESAIVAQNKKLEKHGGLSADQVTALRHMLSPNQISCVVGYAGAGKTTCLEAAKDAWEMAGYKVIGLAPTGRAADNLVRCGIRSMTVHKFLHAQGQGREQVCNKSVLVLDEAGMLDSRRLDQLETIAKKAGAKFVPIGDGNQLQAVEAGPAFRLLTSRVEPAVLETIVRQQEGWQRDATRLFGSLNTRQAIEFYQENGAFKTINEPAPNGKDTRVHTKRALVAAWAQDQAANPTQSHIMLAFTNKDVSSLNQEARNIMREQGVITGKDFIYKTCYVERDDFGKETRNHENKTFAYGDRLLFTHNDNGLGVKNGTLGTIVKLDQNKITVKIDDAENDVSFSPKLYPFFDNGWATTIHKAQGVSVDHVKLLASFALYRNLTYVGMSRHRLSLEVYGSSLEFGHPNMYAGRLSRIQEKLSALDYLDAEEIQAQLKADEKVLWPTQKIQKGRDFWNAVKVTAKEALTSLLYETVEVKPVQETYRSFDYSEEKRSVDLFTVRENLSDARVKFEMENQEKYQAVCELFHFKEQYGRTPTDADKPAVNQMTEQLVKIAGDIFEERALKDHAFPPSAEISIKAYEEFSTRLKQEKAGITPKTKSKEQQECQTQEQLEQMQRDQIVSRSLRM
jgi:Ti-type conjugative transfer relaxase TraA